MAFLLPREILYMILDLLRDERDYDSIYQCAVSSTYFTEEALGILYQLHDTAPVTGGGRASEDEQIKAQRAGASLDVAKRWQERAIWKWAVMWRSIILSTLDQTYLPYYSYIRQLNLDDLSSLLSHTVFKGRIKEEFFTPELYDFVYQGKRLRSRVFVDDSNQILTKVGSAITKRTNSIRGMSCNREFYVQDDGSVIDILAVEVPHETLSELLEGLPSLQTLAVWSGDSLMNHIGDKIHKHCPEFKRITIYRWSMANYPEGLAEIESERFLNELRPQMLEYFELLSYSRLGPRSIRAFGCHLNSLTELKLTSLRIEAIAELPSLTAPPALRVLVLTDSLLSWSVELYSTITRVAQWIRSCKSLQRLELRKFVDDVALLSQALTDDGPRLTTLSLASYVAENSRPFHEALASQQSLQNLYLSGEGLELPEDNEVLVQAITQLKDLRELELKEVSDGFTPDHIIALTPFLPHLKKLWISGDRFDDGIWNAFLCLPKLQSLVINALSEFTTQGVLDFIAQLGPSNRGLNLSILNSTTEASLTVEEQDLIQDTLDNSLDGTFDFGLAHEEYSDVDSEEFSD